MQLKKNQSNQLVSCRFRGSWPTSDYSIDELAVTEMVSERIRPCGRVRRSLLELGQQRLEARVVAEGVDQPLELVGLDGPGPR